jgi:TolB protein
MSSSGGSLKQLTFGHAAEGGGLSKPPQFDGSGSFSPDGKLIAYAHDDGAFNGSYSQHSSIYVMSPDGSGRRAIMTLKDYAGGVSGLGWSPDGARLIYTFANDSERALFLVNADGTGARRLTDWKLGANGTADWSSTGDLIVFRAVQDEESGIGNLYTIHPDGEGLTQITHLHNKVISHIVSFSPDGHWITSTDGPADGGTDTFIARSDGSQYQVIAHTTTTKSTGPQWAAAG